MVELTDTHCHIQSIDKHTGERTSSELWAKAPGLTSDEVLQNAANNHVTRLICVGCDLEDSELALLFANKHQQCWASIGIHPHEAKDYSENHAMLAAFTELAGRSKVVMNIHPRRHKKQSYSFSLRWRLSVLCR
jgi:Tat protein secretion system quality control protein TatD with DNase activity